MNTVIPLRIKNFDHIYGIALKLQESEILQRPTYAPH